MVGFDLSGRVYLVCGVARGGIGGATARAIAAAGGAVFAIDHAQDIVDETVADITGAGGRAAGLVADLLDDVQTYAMVPAVLAAFGRLDGVANVAGGTRADEWLPLEETTTTSFRRTLNLNLEYVFRVCRDAANHLIAEDQPGAFVNVGSVSALASAPWHGPYGAAKSGIAALTRTMAFEWQDYGIRANTVQPGSVLTERVRNRAAPSNITGDARAEVKWTSVDELANVIVFLLSDLASGVSGQTISVDSGLSTKFCAASRSTSNKQRKAERAA